MLTHPNLEKLQTLRFDGMLKALREQMQMPQIETLSFEERLGLLVDRELTERENRRLQTRLRKAKLRHDASIEDLDWRAARGLDRSLVMQLAGCRWIERHHNVVITGATGVGNPRWPAPWPTKPASTVTARSISVCRACWKRCA